MRHVPSGPGKPTYGTGDSGYFSIPLNAVTRRDEDFTEVEVCFFLVPSLVSLLLILPSILFFYSSLLVCLPTKGVPFGFACLPSLYLLFYYKGWYQKGVKQPGPPEHWGACSWLNYLNNWSFHEVSTSSLSLSRSFALAFSRLDCPSHYHCLSSLPFPWIWSWRSVFNYWSYGRSLYYGSMVGGCDPRR